MRASTDSAGDVAVDVAAVAAEVFGPPLPVLSYSPLTLSVPGRAVDLQVRVSAPVGGGEGWGRGGRLPVVLLSHGHGSSNNLSSLNGYAPLADVWASAGIVVVQPTHLSSRTLSRQVADAPGAPLFWRSRAADMSGIIDRLDVIENAVPQLAGRIDRERIAVAGHSLGGHTAGLLLGARTVDPDMGEVVNVIEPRITAGVLLAAPGRGGDVINGPRADLVPFFRGADFSTMTTPALVIAGDEDDSRHFTDVGPDWHADPYRLAPAPKTLLTLFGAAHGLGGIAGYDAAETTDENPDMVAALGLLSAAYLRRQFELGDDAWHAAVKALTSGAGAVGRVESK